MSYIKTAAIGLIAGLFAGLFVGGIGGRITMRLVVLSTDRFPEFTLEGTLNILLIGAIGGAIAGLLFVSVRRFIPAAPLLKGPLYGALAFLVLFAPSASDSMSELFLAPPVLGISLFAALFIGYGIVLQALIAWLDRSQQPTRMKASKL